MSENSKPAVSAVIQKMIEFYNGNLHDIDHFMKVWAFAKAIGELERLDGHTLYILELAAITHDIACPLCREKYNNTNGKNQELESLPLLEEFFEEFSLCEDDKYRVLWLVSHHHTYSVVNGCDYQILLEADFIVNAGESGFSKSAIENACNKIFRTASGRKILSNIFL